MKFLRIAKLVINIRSGDNPGTITLTGLRISFSLQKNLSTASNPGVIKIWNLSSDHRNLINNFGDEVTLYAGYERGSGLELLYRGDTIAVSHTFTLPDIVTTLECADGDQFVNQKHFSLSFAPQTKVRTVIQEIANNMGIPIAEFGVSDDLVYPRGFSHDGMGKEGLNKACAYPNLQWSVQNGALQVVPIDGTIEEPAFKINVDTGMIGIPQRYTFRRQDFIVLGPAVGWKVNTLLYPIILPGAKLDIQSRYLGFQGIFRCETIRHSGDTFGPNWESNMEVTQLPV